MRSVKLIEMETEEVAEEATMRPLRVRELGFRRHHLLRKQQ